MVSKRTIKAEVSSSLASSAGRDDSFKKKDVKKIIIAFCEGNISFEVIFFSCSYSVWKRGG